MQSFFTNLNEGLEKDEALRQAKLAFLSDPASRLVAHPHFWVPFVLVGKDEPIIIHRSWESKLFYFFMVVLILAGILWFFRKKYSN